VVGTADRAILEIAWNFVTSRRFPARKVCDRGLQRMVKGQKMTFDAEAVEEWEHPEFEMVRAIEMEPVIYIVAFHSGTRRIFQFAYHRRTLRKDRRFENDLFRRFVDQPVDHSQVWEFLGMGWRVPPGYLYEFATLNLGDMRLGFSFERGWGRRGILQCRQVYPADFALEKQGHDKWTEYFYQKMAAQYFIPRQGLRNRKLEHAPFQYKEFKGIACRAKLHPFLRFPFRPFVFRTPSLLWTLSVVHEPANRLVQVHFGGDRKQADDILSFVLENLSWKHWPKPDGEKFSSGEGS